MVLDAVPAGADDRIERRLNHGRERFPGGVGVGRQGTVVHDYFPLLAIEVELAGEFGFSFQKCRSRFRGVYGLPQAIFH